MSVPVVNKLTGQPYVTEIDFTQAQLPRETIKFLAGNMPVVQDAQAEGGLDCESRFSMCMCR